MTNNNGEPRERKDGFRGEKNERLGCLRNLRGTTRGKWDIPIEIDYVRIR